jgi:DNA-binding XRE family transcriptional regulator
MPTTTKPVTKRGGRRTPRPTPFSDFRLDFTPMARRRRYLGMSQRQVALAIGVHPVTVNRTERNRSEPTFSQMLAIARALGTPIHQLVEVIDAKPI